RRGSALSMRWKAAASRRTESRLVWAADIPFLELRAHPVVLATRDSCHENRSGTRAARALLT
ncbi:MAG: hypothetical protein ACRETY_02285, partial [Steroidobacteraceae bacterium]